MAPAYKQVSLTDGVSWNKQCPSANGGSRCRNKPANQLSNTSAPDKEDYQRLVQELLTQWNELSKEQRYAKGTRVTMLSVCRKHDTEDDVKSVRKRMLDDLEIREGCGPPQKPNTHFVNPTHDSIQEQASSSSSARFGRPQTLSLAASWDPQTPTNTSGRATAPIFFTPESISSTPRAQDIPTHRKNPSLASTLSFRSSPLIKTDPLSSDPLRLPDDVQRPADHDLAEENRRLRAENKLLKEKNQLQKSLAREWQREASAQAQSALANKWDADKWNKAYVRSRSAINELSLDAKDLKELESNPLCPLYEDLRNYVERLDIVAKEIEEDE